MMLQDTTPAVPAYRAEILHPAVKQDCDRLDVLRALPHVEWIDTLRQQRLDLARIRREPQVDRCIDDPSAADGVFAYYPWARRVVRLLPEADFIELRTSRNQLKITRSEQERLASRIIGIVGLSVGQSVALTIALERTCGELRLADFDTVDLSNLNRLRCGVHHLGVNKAVVAAREIAELDPYFKVTCFVDGYRECDAAAFFHELDLLVEECDSLDTKVRVREEARKRGVPVLMNTSDRGMTDIERFDLEPERALFHGRTALPPSAQLAGLSTGEKIPLVLDILGIESISTRLRASMLEIGSSLTTWPQLASDVTLGGALVTDVARRILLGGQVPSGRFHVDMDALLGSMSEAAVPKAVTSSRACSTNGHDPIEIPADDALHRIVADARLAPSAGNAQPWRWRREGMNLVLDRRPAIRTSSLYHGDRSDLVGLGATLETACISAAGRGYDVSASGCVNGKITLRLTPSPRGRESTEPLFDQIAVRRSDRSRPRQVMPLSAECLDALAAQTSAFPGVRLSLLQDRESLQTLADLVARAEALRILDPASHGDLVQEVCWSREEHEWRGDGIGIDALGLSPAEQCGLRLLRDPGVPALLREAGVGEGLGKLQGELVASGSAMGLLWCAEANDEDLIAGGRALQRIWLRATELGIGLCPITSIGYVIGAGRAGSPSDARMLQAVPMLDRELARLFGLPASRGDIVLFRLVPADRNAVGMPRTERLPLAEVFQSRGSAATSTRSRPAALAL